LTPDQQLKAEELRQQAQNRRGAQQERMQSQMLKRLTSQLDLSESQQSSIKLYLDDQKNQLDILRDNPSLTASDKLGEMQRIRQETQEKIRATLTADQQAQLDAMRKQMQDRMQGRRRPLRRGPRGGEFHEQGLTL
jgi:hypothetical protein